MLKTVRVEYNDPYAGTRVDIYDEVTDVEVSNGVMQIVWENGATIFTLDSFNRVDIEPFEEDE